MTVDDQALVERLHTCLDRRTPIDSISALRRATGGERLPEPTDPGSIAFGLDTNAVFKLATDRANTEAVDYLASRHSGPIVLPGQVVQEFWNNRLNAVETYADVLKNRYRALADEVGKLDPSYGAYDERFKGLLDEFASTYAFAFEPGTAARIVSVLETLQTKAIVSYVPRSTFVDIANIRDQTKTPPGFKDAGHGDFFVWADFLLGLLTARAEGRVFERCVLITADEKIDWSRGGQAHPLLVAESEALLAVPFETWNLVRLRNYVADRLASEIAAADPSVVEDLPAATPTVAAR